MPRTFWQRHRLLQWLTGITAVGLLLLGIAIGIAVHRAEPFLRNLIVQRLEERFHARVELDSFHISLTRGLRAQGKGLRIWPPADVEGVAVPGSNHAAKPLITLAEFHFRAPLHYDSGKPIHISGIQLEGLTIDVPPRPHLTHEPEPPTPAPAPAPLKLLRFQVDSVLCTNATLTLETSNPQKQPLVFAIQTVKVTHITPSGSMNFAAVLTNPRPKGVIAAQGSLGPWMVEDPGETPIDGGYHFDHADLSVFKGIAGILSSRGRYQGSLRNLNVDGSTQTPDFALTKFGSAMPLQTTFHARVDGTNGDTWLDPVQATLGHTRFTARGKIVQVQDHKPSPAHGESPAAPRHGHEIVLNVDVPRGDIGDFLRLTSKGGQPLMTGTLQMKTTFELPPGSDPVHERMRLKGSFRLQDTQFSNARLQQRVGELSLRGQGKHNVDQAAAADVRATMEGDFSIAEADVQLPHLVFIVPGAEIDLHGNYGMDGESLSFRGTARMKATVSHLVGGWKGWLLKPVDPFFRKDGAGTKVKVHVYGTRKDPQFGVDF